MQMSLQIGLMLRRLYFPTMYIKEEVKHTLLSDFLQVMKSNMLT